MSRQPVCGTRLTLQTVSFHSYTFEMEQLIEITKGRKLCKISVSLCAVMIAQWDSSLSVFPVTRVQFPATAEYFKGFSPG